MYQFNLSDSPTLLTLLAHVSRAHPNDRLGVLLAFIADHGAAYSVQYLQPNWRKGERHETPLVTFCEPCGGDTVACDVRFDCLPETVANVGVALGY